MLDFRTELSCGDPIYQVPCYCHITIWRDGFPRVKISQDISDSNRFRVANNHKNPFSLTNTVNSIVENSCTEISSSVAHRSTIIPWTDPRVILFHCVEYGEPVFTTNGIHNVVVWYHGESFTFVRHRSYLKPLVPGIVKFAMLIRKAFGFVSRGIYRWASQKENCSQRFWILLKYFRYIFYILTIYFRPNR